MREPSRVLLFDNLPSRRPRAQFTWRGGNRDLLNQWELTRAQTFKADNRHLTYGPDFLKLCERTFDLAVFLVAKPIEGFQAPLSVWQALGYFLGRRQYDHDGEERTHWDVIVSCEGPGLSNLEGYLYQHEPPAHEEDWDTYLAAVLEHITNLVANYVAERQDVNEPNRAQVELIRRAMWEGRDSRHLEAQLSLSGYGQAQRACDMKQPSLAFAARSTELLAQYEQISNALGAVLDICRGAQLALVAADPSELNDFFIINLKKARTNLRKHLESLTVRVNGLDLGGSVDLESKISALLSQGLCPRNRRGELEQFLVSVATQAEELRGEDLPQIEIAGGYLATGLRSIASMIQDLVDEFRSNLQNADDLHSAFLGATRGFGTPQ